MKRFSVNKSSFKILITVLLILCAFISNAPDVRSAQKRLGSTPSHPHNFSDTATSAIHAPAGTESRICVFCHTPHSSSADGPLWNRNRPTGPNGDGTFPLYGQLGDLWIDDISGLSEYNTTDYPNGASRLCLSCHDGVTAIGEVINPGSGSAPLGGLGTIESISGPGDPAIIDLTTSHPVSFVYNETVRASIEGNKQVGGSGIPVGSYTLPSAGILDGNQRMQCTACHDPHTDTRELNYDLPMWRKWSGIEANDYDNTCLECHGSFDTGSPGLNQPVINIGGNHNL